MMTRVFPADPHECSASLVDALNRADADAAVALYEDDATFLAAPGRVVTGRAAILEELRHIVASRPTMHVESLTVHVCGDTAVLGARWTLAGRADDGAPVELAGQSVELIRRQRDGSWRYAFDAPFGLST